MPEKKIYQNAYLLLQSQLQTVRYYLHRAQSAEYVTNPVAVEELINSALELLDGWPEELNTDQDKGAVDAEGETSQFS